MKIKVWKCGNCGHEEVIPNDGSVGGLTFKWLGPLTSKVGCPACGSFTIQRASSDSFLAGEFLIVRTKLRPLGKGK